METITFQLEATRFASPQELTDVDRELLAKAKAVVKNAYAPYSKFHVGAALLLENGEVVIGSNQENVAYPNGLCAERVAFFSASSQFPGVPIIAIAITAETAHFNMNHPAAPCGSCRQAMLEYEINQDKPVRLILQGQTGDILMIHSIKSLLPLHFYEEGLSA